MAECQPAIVTRLSAPGVSALATLRVEGPGAVELVDRYFHGCGSKPLGQLMRERIAVGRWGSASGEEIVVGRPAADVCELHCHGGAVAADAIIASLEAAGAKFRNWEEWVAQHEVDAIAAEARIALAQATTESCARIIVDQHQGALRRAIEVIRDLLAAGEREAAARHIEFLLATARLGLHLIEPFRVVLVGTPNAGKSSLLNALLGYQRAIVFDQPGTTRDVLSAQSAIGGWPVQLSDTAGLRLTDAMLERAGIEQMWCAAANADLLLVCIAKDQANRVEPVDLESAGAPVLRVGTKSDVPGDWPVPIDVATSAATGNGIEGLLGLIERRLLVNRPPTGSAVVFTHRQQRCLNDAQHCLRAGRCEASLESLQRIVSGGLGELT
jgi:tRNA modification GTPase